ncbi:vWA domain-containing protein [Nocardia bovistercoris]|uniref:VWA domain-containing protein n=1 Tax=Nocardia bovistercoris TaxID=2785916 RepID=A0A931I6V2_9NOCA|nr:VWA domain-containing protein [Nocardia bovistercoris]MBH0775964.1 VWA domain-containing protein [Nocardia bovistercoris]
MTQSPGYDALPVQSAKSRILITLVVDTSSSMAHENRIGELNDALATWRTELLKDNTVRQQGEIALVTFGAGGVRAIDPSGRTTGVVDQPYVPVTQFSPQRLEAGGVTPMVEALHYAFQLMADRKQTLRRSGHPLKARPLVYMITDGVPTDDAGNPSQQWRDLAPAIRQQEDGKHLLFFAFGVAGADHEVLAGLAPKSWWYVSDVNFKAILKFVSTSIKAAQATQSETAAATYTRANEQVTKSSLIDQWISSQG